MAVFKSLWVVALAGSLAYAEPHVDKVTSVTLVGCTTDGGDVKCAAGVRYLGELVQLWWNDHLRDEPLACAAEVAPASYTFKVGYDYNGGQMLVADADKVQAKWPVCVQLFAKQASIKLLEWWKVLQPIDHTIDVSSQYKVTIAIKK